MSNYNLNDKVVIVTGAGSGNGEAIALAFAKHGSRVVLNDKDEENVKRVASLCEQVSVDQHQNRHLVHVGDLSKENVCEELIQKAIDHYDRIDVLVNNAGVITIRSILDDDFLQHYDHVMNVNTRVPLKLSKLCLPHLVKSKGCIVNISSIGSYTAGIRTSMHYSMSKAALDAMTRLLASEFGPKGVRIVSINPSAILTNIHQTINVPQSRWEEVASTYPLRRAGQPSEVANAVCFAASSAASFITGSNILVDGGYSLNS